MDTRLYLRNTLKLEQGGTGTCCLALWCFRQLRFIRLQAFVGVYRCHKYRRHICHLRQSMELPEPQTFVRRRRTRGQHPRASLESSGASARSSQWQDGLLGPAFRRLQAVDARAQYNRMVGRYLQEAHYTPRGSSVLERGFLEDFEWMSTMQVDLSEHPDRVTRQQVLRWISGSTVRPAGSS